MKSVPLVFNHLQSILYLVAGAKFEPENTRLMDKQRVESVLLASESPYLISAIISKPFFYKYLISRQRLFIQDG